MTLDKWRAETKVKQSEESKVSEVKRYRKKPVVIEAMLFGEGTDPLAVYKWIEENTGGSFDPLSDAAPDSGVSIDPSDGALLIATLEGVMKAQWGDYVIRGVQGEFYPCKPDIFEATYEEVLIVGPLGAEWHSFASVTDIRPVSPEEGGDAS